MNVAAFISIPRSKTVLSDLYHKMAACYRYQGRTVVAKTYDAMALQLGQLGEDLSSIRTSVSLAEAASLLDDQVRRDVGEFLATGTLRKYARLIEKVPVELTELLDIESIGAASIKAIHEELGIDTIAQLKGAVLSGSLKKIRGISNARIELLKRSLKLYKTKGSRLLLWDAILLGNEILRVLRLIPEVEEASLCGSLRRGSETVGDIDIVLNVEECKRGAFLQHFLQVPQVQSLVAAGWKRVSAVLYNNTQLDIRLAGDSTYGAELLLHTGSPDHLRMLNDKALKKGYILTTQGLFDGGTGNYLAGSTEVDIYRQLGLEFIAPELREGGREIFRAGRNMLPELVNFNQIKGDMRIQTEFGKGEASITSIAHYVLNAFPHYEYIVVSDQLVADRYAVQFAEIDYVNEHIGFSFLKKGAIVDISTDGQVSLPDSLLRQFDWVTAVIDRKDGNYMERLMKACEHPLIHCIGNPSGRIIGENVSGYTDWSRLFEKAALTHTTIEVNAQPQHLNLNDKLMKKAIDKGVQVVINTCAQLCSHYDYMQMGVTMARRGWCTKEQVVNANHWKRIEQFKSEKYHYDQSIR